MKVFTENSGSFFAKVNYVDDNNRFAGMDTDQQCCEYFQHGICSSLPDKPAGAEGLSFVSVDLEPYSFAEEPPTEIDETSEYGSPDRLACFRLTAAGLPDLWLVFANHHNGYYAHTVESFSGEVVL